MTDTAQEFTYLAVTRPGLRQNQLTTRPIGDPKHGILIGVDQRGERRILFPPGRSRLVPWSTAALRLRSTGWTDGQREQRFLELVCAEPTLNEAFCLLADDLVDRLTEAGSDDPYPVLASVLDEWEQMFARRRPALSEAEQLGLFVELDLLLTLSAVSPLAALKAWTAAQPGLSLRDFNGNGRGVEVKALSARTGGAVTVHGLDQLDPTTPGLHLHVGRVEQSPTGQTLRDKVEELAQSGFPRGLLYRALSARGYVPPEEGAESDELALSISERLTWKLEPSMPLLGRDDLSETKRAAVSGLQYSVAVSALGEPLTESQFKLLCHSILGGAVV